MEGCVKRTLQACQLVALHMLGLSLLPRLPGGEQQNLGIDQINVLDAPCHCPSRDSRHHAHSRFSCDQTSILCSPPTIQQRTLQSLNTRQFQIEQESKHSALRGMEDFYCRSFGLGHACPRFAKQGVKEELQKICCLSTLNPLIKAKA